jgi:DNA mismatch endonuclease (patch repair protein)
MKSIRARAPAASSARVRKVMQANVGRETSAERALRDGLYAHGLHFERDALVCSDVRCRADLVFASCHVCVFVDGCYWHGCPRHFRAPRTHQKWWKEKIADNKARDRRQRSSLRKTGWHVISVWEHDLRGNALNRTIQKVVRAVEESCEAGRTLAGRGSRGHRPPRGG